MRLDDLTGKQFGQLTVLTRGEDKVYSNGKVKRVQWVCKCTCGKIVTVDANSLRDGKTKSCGCARVAARHRRADYRGTSSTQEYRILRAMIARCRNVNNPYYGGKGIKVCTRWQGVDGLKHLLEDLGPWPGKGWSVDRIDVNGDYCPENCRWANITQQMRNTCRTQTNQRTLTTSTGETHTVFEWADRIGLSTTTINWRLAHGATVDEAVQPGDKRYHNGASKSRRSHPEYQVWDKMKRRCTNPADPKYPDYGGRGITVDKRWTGANGFEHFITDMGPCPAGYTLDRIDVNGPYAPNNCRWASQHTQQNNRRDNVRLTVCGITMTTAEWGKFVGIPGGRVRARMLAHPNAPATRYVYPGDLRKLNASVLAAVDNGEWLKQLLNAPIAIQIPKQVNIYSTDTPEYHALYNAIRRCEDPNDKHYAVYGGRGVRVCARWHGVNGYKHFIDDVGKRPGPKYMLIRIDVNGDYCPANCRWATAEQQQANKRRTAHSNDGGSTQHRSCIIGNETTNVKEGGKE